MLTDPIADMLTRIRNAITAGHAAVEMPRSTLKVKIAEILKQQGYIEDFGEIDDLGQGILKVYLKYIGPKRSAIAGLVRESKPGRRVYAGKDDLPRIKRGLGMAVISTSKGVMPDSEARRQGLGGEVLFTVW